MIFQVTDCINHGIPDLIQPDMRTEITKLNFRAALRAMKLSDYETAQIYFTIVLSSMSADHWENYYNFSLQVYFFISKVAYSCGDVKKTSSLLKEIINKGYCLEDKLDAYYLYVKVR